MKAAASQRIFLVLGSHRTGTSAVTRLLKLLGVRLGPKERLLGAIPGDNEQGFYEHEELMQVNNELLQRLGGSWREPPRLPAEWEHDESLADLCRRARELIERDLADEPVWAFKDPRTSLTLPLWRQLATPTGYLICSRSPLEVARSLERRNRIPLEHGVALWAHYTASAVANTHGAMRLFVAYEELVERPRPETERIAAFLGLPMPDGGGETVDAAVDAQLRHHRSTPEELTDAPGVTADIRELHRLVDAAAGAGDAPAGDAEALGAVAGRILSAAPPRQHRTGDPVAIAPRPRPPRVVAMLQVYNERRFLAACIEHLREQGVGVYVIDNESTDETPAIAERYLGSGVVGIETLGREGVFALRAQCERQEELARTLDADWLIHHDADEFRASPRRGQTLAEAIAEVDEAGFDAINFHEFVFVPTREFPDHDHAAFQRTMRWYYPFLPTFPHRVNAWKRRDERVDLQSTAGHIVRFPGQRLAPESLFMRHYLYISLEHALEKFVRRRFAADELADGWFGWRDNVTEETITLPSLAELRSYVGDHLLDPSEPLTRHLLDPDRDRNGHERPSPVPAPRPRRAPTPVSGIPAESDTAALLHERFEAQVRLRPDEPAIAGAADAMTYRELDELATRYAASIVASCGGDAAGERVGLLMHHGGRLVAAALAVSKCGGVAVALNPRDPAARLTEIREAVEAAAVIADGDCVELAGTAGFPAKRIVEAASGGDDAALPVLPPVHRSPDDLALLICTSGSTGRPKIVMQTHRNMLHNVLRYSNGLGLRSDDRVAWLAALSGGQGLVTTWSTLLNAAALCPFAIQEHGVTQLAAWLREARVTIFDTLPSILRTFARTLGADERLAGIRLVRLASEAAYATDFELFARHFEPDCVLASVLASSETGIVAQARLRPGDGPKDTRLPVGRAVDGIDVLLVDEAGEPVAAGEPGEIVVRSRYLSPGYWREPELTAERFTEADGARSYRSGDLARRSADGALTVTGRRDTQVKIRGNRLQLEEVEATLARHEGVAEAAATATLDERGDARLTAYVVPRPGRDLDPAHLRRTVADVLPPHAVPTVFVVVEALPLTPHGKVDRDRLALLTPAPGADPGRTPRTETEATLALIWADALDRDPLPLDEGFLDLGGDSLSAAVVAAGVDELFDVRLDMATFVANPSVASMAAGLDRRADAVAPEADVLPLLRRLRPSQSAPLTFTQGTMWPQARRGPGLNLAVPYRLLGPLDVDALARSLEAIVARHEILRTSFPLRDREAVAVAHPAGQLELTVEDLRGEPSPEARADRLLAADAATVFDLAEPPLLMRLVRLSDHEHRLLITASHLLCDALSWRIFFDELAELYEASLEGRAALLPDLPLQVGDYAVWERASFRPGSGLLATPAFEAELDWWKQRFRDLPARPPLPFERATRPAAVDADAVVEWTVDAETGARLAALSRAAGATFFVTRLAAFAALLALRSEGEDLLVDTFATARRQAELQQLIGPLINRTTLRLAFDPDASFSSWLEQARGTVVETTGNASVPFDFLWRKLHPRGVKLPPIETKFEALYTIGRRSLGDIELTTLPRRYATPWGFTIGVGRGDEGELNRAVFDPRRYDRDGVASFVEDLCKLLAAVAAEPEAPLRRLHENLFG
jgi:amino acid adenylation domain-containing protein